MQAIQSGIVLCGNLIVDQIHHIRSYPNVGELTKITGLDRSVGGCVPNVGIDLKRICPELPVSVIGRVGNDENGRYVQSVLEQNGLELSGLRTTDEPTSFTQVMSVSGGQRTFFTYAGADGGLCADDVVFTGTLPKLLHLGYFLLLKKVDEGEGLKILKKASEAGIATSVDLVSENSDRYSLVLPCLKYTDYLIINELEAGNLTGIAPKYGNLEQITRKLFALGVRKKVIVHMTDCAVCCSDEGFTVVPSYDVPGTEIVGTTGAGDAFCAGALFAIHEGRSDREILEFASAAAVMALRSADATAEMTTEAKITEHCKRYNRRKLCW